MLVYLDLIYRSNNIQNGGSFKNSKGQEINYSNKYLFIGDYIEENKAFPVVLKTKSEDLNKWETLFKTFKPYEKLNCECELKLYNKNVTLTLLNAKKV